jgi:ribonuclease D
MKISYNYHVNDLPDDLTIEGDIAVDTEAMGLNNHRDRLCLVQLSDLAGNIHLVHFKEQNFSAKNLKRNLTQPNSIKIFHFGRFDLAIMQKYLNIQLEDVFCTKIASKLCRTYTHHHSLAELCSELLHIKISKQQQTSDWGAHRLNEEQLQYASKDVLYLHRLKNELSIRLKREKRFELAKECFKFLPFKAELDLLGWLDHDIFSHAGAS